MDKEKRKILNTMLKFFEEKGYKKEEIEEIEELAEEKEKKKKGKLHPFEKITDLKDMLEANQITSTIQSDNSLASIKAYKKISFKGLLPVSYKIEVKRVIPIE